MSTAAPAPARRVIQSSELSRHSADVFAKAEEGAIEVTRRDGEPLVLLTKREDDERDLALEIASQLIAVSIAALWLTASPGHSHGSSCSATETKSSAQTTSSKSLEGRSPSGCPLDC
jgi:hypothetical protein